MQLERAARRPPRARAVPATSDDEERAGQRERRDQAEAEPDEPGVGGERREHEAEREEQQRRLAAVEHRHELPPRGRRGRAHAAGEHDDAATATAAAMPASISSRLVASAGCDATSATFARVSRVVAGQRVEQHRYRLEDEHVDVGGGDEQRARRAS